jgi:excisionase family DNA binding protein
MAIATMPDYVSTEEAARELGYHVKHVCKMARTGRLRAVKKSRVWWIYRDALDEYKTAIKGKSKHDPTRGH